MRIDKTIKGEKFCFYFKFLPDNMTAKVRYFGSNNYYDCKISEDFKYIILPDNFPPIYIDGVGETTVKKLKLNKRMQEDAKFYNDRF